MAALPDKAFRTEAFLRAVPLRPVRVLPAAVCRPRVPARAPVQVRVRVLQRQVQVLLPVPYPITLHP